MAESDEEFLARLQPSWPGTNDSVRLPMSDFNRLFTLARRGAEVQTVGHLDDGKTSVLRAAGLHQTSAKILEQAEEIRTLRAALREIAGCKTYSDREYMIGIARAALGGGDE